MQNRIINHSENSPLIIRLGPETKISRVSTFEEAFGEYSEARGKRQEKKAARQAARTERKVKKQANKLVKKQAKAATKVGKQQAKSAVKVARQQKRADKKVAKQGVRTSKMQAKQGRKTERKGLRLDRRAMGKEELPQEEVLPTEEAVEENGEISEGGEAQYSEPNTLESRGGSSQEEAEEESEEENVSEEEEPEESTDESEEPADEEGYQEEYEDNFDVEFFGSFDGNEQKLVTDDYFSYCCADGKTVKAKINPKVKEAAMKAEWNKEVVCRLKPLAEQETDEQKLQELSDKISTHMGRAVIFENKLTKYENPSKSCAAGQNPETIRRRSAEVAGARREARKARAGARIRSVNSGRTKGKGLTQVEQELNPKIEPNRITVPGSSSASGSQTGIVYLDQRDDYDAPEALEVQLGFDGIGAIKSINWKWVLAGVVLAGATIYAVNKFAKKA